MPVRATCELRSRCCCSLPGRSGKSREVLWIQVWSISDEPQRMSPDTALSGGVGGDFGDHSWFDLGEQDAIAAAAEPVRGNCVRPRMTTHCGGEPRLGNGTAQLSAGGATGDHQRAVPVETGDDGFRLVDGADHGADDQLVAFSGFHLDPAALVRFVAGAGAFDDESFDTGLPVFYPGLKGSLATKDASNPGCFSPGALVQESRAVPSHNIETAWHWSLSSDGNGYRIRDCRRSG
jgi:hypothetical protein